MWYHGAAAFTGDRAPVMRRVRVRPLGTRHAGTGRDALGKGEKAGMDYPGAYEAFIRLFNKRRFWDSHEVLEGPWRRNRSNFYKGMIIYASAFVHVQRGNPAGVQKQMRKVLNYLPPYRPGYMGLAVDDILSYAEWCRERAVGRDDLKGKPEALAALIPFPRLVLEARHRRGDEPELHEPEGSPA